MIWSIFVLLLRTSLIKFVKNYAFSLKTPTRPDNTLPNAACAAFLTASCLLELSDTIFKITDSTDMIPLTTGTRKWDQQ